MTEKEIKDLLDIVTKKMGTCLKEISELEELSKPISPDNAIGRISRMDAIGNQAINENRLNAAKQRHFNLQALIDKAGTTQFGLCEFCSQPIGFPRLSAMPDKSTCINCAAFA